MITLLHGDNQTASRVRLIALYNEYTERGYEVRTLDGRVVTRDEIALSAETSSLLGQGTVVIVEDFFTRKKSTDREVNNLTGEIIFWESRMLPKLILSKMSKNWRIESFSIPRSVFKFLESLTPRDTKSNINFLHKVLEQDLPEMLLPLLAWHVRQLIWAKEEPDTLVVPSWKKRKLLSQANNFTKEQLYFLHNKLTNLDRDVKTGASPLPLNSSLDLVIATL